MPAENKKPPFTEVQRWLIQVINGAKHNGRKFPKIFYVTEPSPGRRAVLENIGKNVVRYVDKQAVVNALLDFQMNVEMGSGYELTHRRATEIMNAWMGTTQPIPEPKYIAEKDDKSICFQRLPFNYNDEPGQTLVIDEFFSRCSNAEAMKALLGSLTVEDSPRYQYGYFFGSGGEGKGSIGRALADLIGPGCITMPVPKTDGQKQFLAYSLQGKRLCVFPECSNFNFPQDPLFKQFTGNDMVWLEAKGVMGYSSHINVKFLFFSNDKPGVGGNDANMRRMIYSEVAKPTVMYPANVYDALIRQEMPHFILKCRKLYFEMCPNHEDIKVDDEKTRDLVEINEERWEVLTEKWMEIKADGVTEPGLMQAIKANEKLNGYEYRQWTEYMRLKFGVESKSIRLDGAKRTKRYWVGVTAKSDPREARAGVITNIATYRDRGDLSRD
jgi:hypothetical protein